MSHKTQPGQRHRNAMWAASKIQARFRGRKTRSITSNKKLAVLKGRTGLGLMVMSRIAEFATSTSTNFIKQLEEEASGHHAATVLSEATGDDKNRANNIGVVSSILEGKTLDEIKKAKEALVGFEMDDDCFNADNADEQTLTESSATKMNLFVKEYPIYPKLIVSFEAHSNHDDNEGIIVQRCWVEVPPKNKPMRYLRVRQDQLDDAQRIVVRHSEGDMKKDNDQMSEGGFSSASSFGDSDDLNSLYSEDEDEDLELSTNLHDLM
jgi:hypothetical protein